MNNIYDELKIVEKDDNIYEEIVDRFAFKEIKVEYKKDIPLEKIDQFLDTKNKINNIYTFPSNGGLKKFLDYYWSFKKEKFEDRFCLIEHNKNIYIINLSGTKSYAFEEIFCYDRRIEKFKMAKVRYEKYIKKEIELSYEELEKANREDTIFAYIEEDCLSYLDANCSVEKTNIIEEEVYPETEEFIFSYNIDEKEDFEDFKDVLENEK